jgi:hypothetical protein
VNQTVGLQLAQLLGEHLAGGVGELALQVGKTHGRPRQVPEDRGLPFAADHRQGDVDAAGILFVPVDQPFRVELSVHCPAPPCPKEQKRYYVSKNALRYQKVRY